MMPELALWKSKIIEQYNMNNDTLTVDTKLQCRTDSLSMLAIIVPNVLSFFTLIVMKATMLLVVKKTTMTNDFGDSNSYKEVDSDSSESAEEDED
jgi:hypothetical protein